MGYSINTPGLMTPIVTTPSRTIGVTFTPSSSRPTMVFYTIRITNGLSLSAQTGRVELLSDNSQSPTTVRAQSRLGVDVAGLISGGVEGTTDATLTYIVPAGEKVTISSVSESGSPSFSIVQQVEITL